MPNPLKNVIIAGATGAIGQPILSALLAHPSLFNVTILARTTSTSSYPADVPTITVSDALSTEELTVAFKNQDVVILATSTEPITLSSSQATVNPLSKRFIDAAFLAGVRRFIPSTYGTDNYNPTARDLVPIYASKGATLDYLQEKSEESGGTFTWSSIACGLWLDFALAPSICPWFLGIDIQGRKAPVWDSGHARFAVTTTRNTGLAVAKILFPEHFEHTANKQIFVADFITDYLSLVACLEEELGQAFELSRLNSAPKIKELREQHEAGDGSAAHKLVAMSVVADVDGGYEFDKEQELWNDRLDLPRTTLWEVVRGVMGDVPRT